MKKTPVRMSLIESFQLRYGRRSTCQILQTMRDLSGVLAAVEC